MRICAITGHRPKSFPWKYNEMDRGCILLKETLTGQVGLLVEQGVTDWLTGMAQGGRPLDSGDRAGTQKEKSRS